MMRKFAIIVFPLLLIACGGEMRDPLVQLQKRLGDVPEYSVMLADMNIEGNFFPQYYHKYKIVTLADSIPVSQETDWLRVSEDQYRSNENNLGMVLLRKGNDGRLQDTVIPPGYQYVGNDQYGRWRTDASGNSFWEWYGKYAMLQTVFGWGSYRMPRGEYDTWQRRSGRGTFYGQNKQWGTSGKVTQKANPSFFQRRMAKQSAAKSSFSNKVRSRTRTSYRSRSGGFGK
jgi:hypothetical protein